MTPSARLQAQIEVLEQLGPGPAPADRVLGDYTRARRYIGANDRRAIVEGVYAAVRHCAKLRWWRARVGGTKAGESGRRESARNLVIAASALIDSRDAAQMQALFDGAPYHPAPLDNDEMALARSLSGHSLEHPDQDASVRLELPNWLMPHFAAAFGPDLETEMAALNREAPLDLRVNSLKSDRDGARAALAREGIEAVPIALSPLGLRVAGRRAVIGTQVFRDGLIEVQDAGSQVAALLADARPGMAVADFCAGAGGKALALAAAMENSGRLVALDVAQARLDRAAPRLRRAGASLVERRVLRGDGWLKREAGRFDRVLVDAACSGSGAWRRDPYARWQLTAERLAQYRAVQADSLKRAATLVRPGGLLIYVTCSLLREENGMQIQDFLAGHPGFAVRPAAQVWAETLGARGAAPPDPAPFQECCLLLTPARHGSDGFFVAVMARGAVP